MKRYFMYPIIIVLLGWNSFSLAWETEQVPEPLFYLTSDQIDFYGGKYEGMAGAMAMEYYDGYLYIASRKQILKVSLKGEIIDTIYNFKEEHIPFWIFDFTFFEDTLYVWQAPQKLFAIKDRKISKKYFVDFHSQDVEEITKPKNSGFYFQPPFISIVDNKLFFHNNYEWFALETLNAVEADNSPQTYFKADIIYLNKSLSAPTLGGVISDCESVEWIGKEFSLKNMNFRITNHCEGSVKTISHPIITDPNDIRTFSIMNFYKNNYLNNYFIFAATTELQGFERTIEYWIVFLDQHFNIKKTVKNIKYYPGISGLSPRYKASFTYDENGNVYYCTNKFDLENPQNSIVEVYQIGGVK